MLRPSNLRRVRAAIAVFALTLAPAAAAANTYSGPDPAAPEAQIEIIKPRGWSIQDPAHLSDKGTECVSAFVNHASQTAIWVEFVFSFLDGDGKVIEESKAASKGMFAPGIFIRRRETCVGFDGWIERDGTYYVRGRSSSSVSYVSKILVSIDGVNYFDGTKWRAPPK